MSNFSHIIKKTSLFCGIDESEVESLLVCLGEKTKTYKKNEYILRVGDSPEEIALILTGSVLVIQEDYWGNRNIRAHLTDGQIFAESYACVPGAVMDISVVADVTCEIMWLNVKRILTTCPTACEHHGRLIRNLLSDLAEKNLRINKKLTHISKRTTREKLLSYLSAEAQHQNRKDFYIHFNRQQLADYLSVERSAMSAELSKMQNDGLITFNRNFFILH